MQENLDNEESIIANCLNVPHNEKEIVESHDSENLIMTGINKIKVVMLAGGLRTRLPEYTKKVPKPMVKINNKPNFNSYQSLCKIGF